MSVEDLTTCFVIMPYGEKKDIDGTIVDFEAVYETIIKRAIEDIGITVYRADRIEEGGVIVKDMFDHILNDDVAIVDITTLNANVFYELGARHALRRSVTVLIRKKGSQALPFNIRGLRVTEYDLEDRKTSRKNIARLVKNGLKKMSKVDSLVHSEIGDQFKVIINKDRQPLPHTVLDYELSNVPGKYVGLITGDIQKVKEVDIWVNSENTNMQMARFYDRNISGVIRYLGAEKNPATKRVKRDTIADELTAIMEGESSVDAGTIVPTTAGELEKTHNVKKIFHAASVNGQIGKGYKPIHDISVCITNSLKKMDEDFSDQAYRSILFPLMGTGAGGGDLSKGAKNLIEAAINYLEANPESVVKNVYFLAWSEAEKDVCMEILGKTKRTES